MALPRGLRNNNPLNIRHSKVTYTGEIPGPDKSFKRFAAMFWGYRAAFRVIQTYIRKYDRNTIRLIIERWAPPSENDTEAYIRNVEKLSGIHETVPFSETDERLIKVVAAMSEQENGIPAVMDDVQTGWAAYIRCLKYK